MDSFRFFTVGLVSLFSIVVPAVVVIAAFSTRKKTQQTTYKRTNYSAGSMCEDGDSHRSHTGVVQQTTYLCPYSAETRPRCRDCTDILCSKSPFYQG